MSKLGDLPSLRKDQGRLKADLAMTMKSHDLKSVKDRLGNDRGEYLSPTIHTIGKYPHDLKPVEGWLRNNRRARTMTL
jgi:hypothetical protein